jgi:hypothetical protein
MSEKPRYYMLLEPGDELMSEDVYADSMGGGLCRVNHNTVPMNAPMPHLRPVDGYVADLKAENERLRAIVDKLPMTDDGVRVVPNSDYWTIHYWHGRRGELLHVRLGLFAYKYGTTLSSDHLCFTSPEAAEAALADREAAKESEQDTEVT